MRRRLTFAATAAAITAASLVVPPHATAAPPRGINGSTSGGDPYFPAAGNGGYQVKHYDLRLKYRPTTKALAATRVPARRGQSSLRSFNLDLRDLTVESVTVDGPAGALPAEGRRARRDAAPGPCGRSGTFVVRVGYGGTTGQPEDNTGALYGWVSFADGAFVANEPEGASTWYPVNDVPDRQGDATTSRSPSRRARPRSPTANWSARRRARAGRRATGGRPTRWRATCPWPPSATTT